MAGKDGVIMAKLDEFDKEKLKGVYNGKGESGDMDMSELETNLRLLHSLKHPFGQDLFPEETDELIRVGEERTFLELDEFSGGDEELFFLEEFYENFEAKDRMRQRMALEAVADEILRSNPDVSTDATPGPAADADYRQHEKEAPKLKHRISRYEHFEVVYDKKRQVKHPSHRRIIGMKLIAA